MPVDQIKAVEMLKRIHLFRGIDEQKLIAATNLMEVAELQAGTVVYQEGDAPDFFYFIFGGRIRINRINPELRQIVSLGFLDDGDYFGQEVLEGNWPRQVTAETETDATLLRLSVPNFTALLEILPILGQRLQLILDSYRLMLRTSFAWIDPQETVYYVARRHVLFLWLHILPPILTGIIMIPLLGLLLLPSAPLIAPAVLLLAGLALGLWLVWGYIDWSNDYYVVTNRRILYQEKVILLYDSRQESPIEAIQSTSINTTQVGRILGYGNVAIRTYIGTILFRDVNKPELVMSLIQEQQVRSTTSQRRAELRAMETTIERRISGAQSSLPSSKPGAAPARPSALQRFISDLLHLRYEVGGTVLYRTHWYILLKKVGIQTLLLGGLLFLVFGRLFNLYTLLTLQTVCGLNALVGLVVFAWFAYQYLDWHNDIYLITPDQIVDVNKKPLGREERRAAPIKNILSIEYKRLGIIGLLLNFGTVYIRVGDQQLTFDNVFNPSEVQRELFHHLAAKNYSERQAQAENERQRMADWIAAYHRVSRSSQPPPSNNPPIRGGF